MSTYADDQFDLDVRVANSGNPMEPALPTIPCSIPCTRICTRVTCRSCTCGSCITACPIGCI